MTTDPINNSQIDSLARRRYDHSQAALIHAGTIPATGAVDYDHLEPTDRDRLRAEARDWLAEVAAFNMAADGYPTPAGTEAATPEPPRRTPQSHLDQVADTATALAIDVRRQGRELAFAVNSGDWKSAGDRATNLVNAAHRLARACSIVETLGYLARAAEVQKARQTAEPDA
jgi:hypothetical protein